MSHAVSDVIYLAACAVNGTVPETSRVESLDLDAVYSFASRHMITAAVAFALKSAGIKDERFDNAIAANIRKTMIFDKAWNEIKAHLEEAGIWYMPLKGAVLKGMYPKYGMREFADYDILFDASRASDVKQIMEASGFTTECFAHEKHDIYFGAPMLNFEMHKVLFASTGEEKLYKYYTGIEDRLVKGPGYERHFTPEDFYLYFVAHAYKHYEGRGTGLRSLMDTYVYLRQVRLDTAYVAAEADKLGLGEYEKQNRSLAMHLFGEGELTESDREMLNYIVSSGTFGTFTHNVQNKIRKNRGGRIGYMLDRFSIPVSRKNPNYALYAESYPLFYKHKILLPLLPFYRVARSLRQGRFQAEAKAIRESHTSKG